MVCLIKTILLFIFIVPLAVYGQHSEQPAVNDIQQEQQHDVHHEFKHFRAALLIGHTLIPRLHAHENIFIPSWGFDLEYWPQEKWGIGIHSDLEIETFVIIRNAGEEEEIERVTPMVITLDALFKPWKDLVIQIGPGIEIEKEENFSLFRVGVEYEFELNNHWDIAPTIFYDTRFNEYHTWSIALGIGKRF